MLGRWVGTVTVIVVRRVHRVGHTIKALLRPARTVTALAGAAAIDALRPRSELMAENALLRQQILVLRRTAPPRPAPPARGSIPPGAAGPREQGVARRPPSGPARHRAALAP